MSRHLRFLGINATVLLCVLGVLLAPTFQKTTLAYASIQPSDSLVIIAIDATGKNCIKTAKVNISTSHITTMRMPCLAGTVMATKLVPLSQAIHMHIPYVIPSPLNASASAKQTTIQSMQAMMQKESQKLLASSAHNQVSPLTGCGNNGEYGVNWDPEGGYAFSDTVLFYKSSDCSTIFFQTARIMVNYSTYCEYYWLKDLYAGYDYSVPGQPILSTVGHLYYHNVSQSAPQGYYYENWVVRLASAPNCENGLVYYINIGPIN